MNLWGGRVHSSSRIGQHRAHRLSDQSSDIDAKDEFGYTPLHWAAIDGDVESIKVRRRDLRPSPIYDRGPLTQALLDRGASKSVEDNAGRSPYDVICMGAFAACSESTRSEIESLLSPSAKSA